MITIPTDPKKQARNGLVFVLSGPSGTGKTSLYRQLLKNCDNLTFSVSCTTRPPRDGECHGTDYYFLSRKEFQQHIKAADFLEHAEVHGNLYGTLKSEVENHLKCGEDILLDIDVQGAQQIRSVTQDKKWAAAVVFLFVGPPSLQELERRLRGRGTDAEDVIRRRLRNSTRELALWREYDYLVVNEDLEKAEVELQQIVQAARCQTRLRQTAPWEMEINA